MNEVRLRVVASNVVEKSDGTMQPFIGLEDLDSGTGRLLAGELPIKAAADSIRHRPGDVLFSKLRPYLAKSYQPVASGTATGELLVLRPKPAIDTRFLFYVTLSSRWLDWANTTSYGTKMPRTSWEALSDYRLQLPSLVEQRRISDFLDLQVARYRRLASALASADTLALERRAAVVNGVWDFDAPTVRLGYRLSLATSGSRSWSELVGERGSIFFRSANLRRNAIEPNLSSVVRVNPPAKVAAEAGRARIRRNDVLIGITGANTGWVSLAGSSVVGGYVSQHVCLVRPGRDVHGRWLSYVMSSTSVQQSLFAAQYGGTKTQLSLPDIRNIRVPIYPIDVQRSTAGRVDREVGRLDALRRIRLQEATLLKEKLNALITRAVAGELDVTTAQGVE